MSEAVLIDPAELIGLIDHLHRVLRLDRTAPVRLRGVDARLTVWSRVLDVLVAGEWPARLAGADITVDGAELASSCAAAGGQSVAGTTAGTVVLPKRVDSRWPGALPPGEGWRLLDEVPGHALAGIVSAGAETFRTVAANAPLPARVGTALLDHIAVTVRGGTDEVAVPLRVPQALTRTGLLDAAASYRLEVTPTWYRLAGSRGAAYRRRGGSALTLTPAR